MECNKAKCGKEFHVSHLCTLQSKHLDRLHVLRKGPRLPRLTVDCWVPTIITDYPSSLLNGKRLAKRRQAKIWLIIAHSVNNFIRSELPVWKSDMAGKEIGKRRKMWQKLRTILHKSTIALTLTSTVRVWRNRNLELHYTQIWCCFIEFGSNRCLSNHILFNLGMESDFYPWWCEQTLVPTSGTQNHKNWRFYVAA